MANNAILARLANLWTGFISLWVTDVEKAHPEIAYQNAINGMINKYAKLKDATGAIIARRQDITGKLESQQAERARVGADLDAAMATGQDDLAVVLIQKKNLLDGSINELQLQASQAEKDSEDAKASLLQVKAEIDRLKAERDNNLAKLQSAQARLQIQEQLDGLSVDAEVRALDSVRDHIKGTVAKAQLGEELRDSDLDTRLSKLRNSSGELTARAELERMKAARQQAATKTL